MWFTDNACICIQCVQMSCDVTHKCSGLRWLIQCSISLSLTRERGLCS